MKPEERIKVKETSFVRHPLPEKKNSTPLNLCALIALFIE